MDRGALLAPDDVVYLFTNDVLSPTPLGTLPASPATPTLASDDVAPPLAAFGGSEIVWIAIDGSVRATSTLDVTTRTLAPAATNALALAADGERAAWRTTTSLVIYNLATDAAREVRLATATVPMLALTPTAAVTADDTALRVVRLDSDAVSTLSIGDATAHAVASDGCNSFVVTTEPAVNRRAFP